MFAGRLGDRCGHRRTFAVGMLGFGAASAGIGLAPGVGWVIGLRVVQGVFGALLQPATLGMLRALLPAVVFGVLVIAVRDQERSASATPGPRPRLDLPGALLLAVCLVCLVHALVVLPRSGWTPGRGLTLIVAGAAAVAFVRHGRRAPNPLVPSDVVRAPSVTAALGLLTAASAALQGTLFTCVYVLQDELGHDPLGSALLSLPLALLMVAAAAGCAVLLRRFGARRTAVPATAVLTLGILVLAQASAAPALCAGFALVGAGFGTVMVAGTHVVVRQAPLASAGVAGGCSRPR